MVRALEDDRMRIITAVDIDPATAEFARARGIDFTTDYDAVLGDEAVEAVILCTPNAPAYRSGRARCPGGEARLLREAAGPQAPRGAGLGRDLQANGVLLGVGHELRFKPPVLELAEMLSSGELGTVMQSEVTFSTDNLVDLPAGHWRRSEAQAPCGPLTATAVHGLDLCVSVHGAAESVLASLRKMAGPAVDDSLSILVHFKDGADALITSLSGSPFSARFAVFGTKGWVQVSDKAHPEEPEGWILTRRMRGGRMESVESPPVNLVQAALEAFADAVRGRAPYPIAQEDMIETIAILEAVVKSAASGRIERVEGK